MTEKAALFIDGANLYHASRSIGLEIDFSRLLRHFSRVDRIARAFYYTALVTENGQIRRYDQVTWLTHNGYTVVTKPAKVYTDHEGSPRVKGNMDIEMAVDIIKMAPVLDRIYLFTGDGDFTPLVKYIQETHTVQITVVSTLKSHPVMIADELRRQADSYIDLDNIRNDISSRRVRPRGVTEGGSLVTMLRRAGE